MKVHRGLLKQFCGTLFNQLLTAPPFGTSVALKEMGVTADTEGQDKEHEQSREEHIED